ncbi:hypothetical protein I3760_13G068500 [Carya illinoinensis]|nr:hypothetical protein I3760_13G068500 [Carya illinoinensis]
MERPSGDAKPSPVCHVVAMPFPGRGHINPMMNLCKLLSSNQPNLLISFVVTEEWLGYIGSDTKPDNIRFTSIPDGVVPPERLKAADFPGFYEATMTKMEAPFEELLDRLEPPVDTILGDVELLWVIGVGNRRNIAVASLWTMPATFFSMLHHYHVFVRNRQLPVDFMELRDEHMDIPGLSSTQAADLRTVFHGNDQRVLQLAMECISRISKAQYLLFTSVYDLEPQAIDSLNAAFNFPVYPIGPAIPYLEFEDKSSITSSHNDPKYLQWLDSQPSGSVLYISLGSFLSVSGAQMDEIAAGLHDSNVQFLWVARGEASRLNGSCGDKGLVVPWCDQMKVLCHSSIGGFWTHCGWNSILEAVYAGVPMLTFPLFLDQVPNSRLIVEDWKIGWRVKGSEVGSEILVTRQEISELMQRFVSPESGEGKELRARARELKDICHKAIIEGGSSRTNLDSFMKSISQSHGK